MESFKLPLRPSQYFIRLSVSPRIPNSWPDYPWRICSIHLNHSLDSKLGRKRSWTNQFAALMALEQNSTYQNEFFIFVFNDGPVVIPMLCFYIWVVKSPATHAFVAATSETQPGDCNTLKNLKTPFISLLKKRDMDLTFATTGGERLQFTSGILTNPQY